MRNGRRNVRNGRLGTGAFGHKIRGMSDDLARWRAEFPILARTVYMINNSLGAMPRRTARDLAEYADTWATRGVRAWEERWWEMPLAVGNKVARVIGAPPGSVSMHENVTSAQLVALSTIRPSPSRNRIVCTAMDFPSVVHLYRAQQRSAASRLALGHRQRGRHDAASRVGRAGAGGLVDRLRRRDQDGVGAAA